MRVAESIVTLNVPFAGIVWFTRIVLGGTDTPFTAVKKTLPVPTSSALRSWLRSQKLKPPLAFCVTSKYGMVANVSVPVSVVVNV